MDLQLALELTQAEKFSKKTELDLFGLNETHLRATPFSCTSTDRNTIIDLYYFWELCISNPNSLDHFEEWQTWNNLQYSSELNLNVKIDGYCPVTNQPNLRLCVCKETDTKKVIRELDMALQYVLPLTEEACKLDPYYRTYEEHTYPYYYIGIFENTLSENGIYSLECVKGGPIKLCLMRYSRHSILKEFKYWNDCIEYLKENCPYDTAPINETERGKDKYEERQEEDEY